MPLNSNKKGKDGELEVVNLLRKLLGDTTIRRNKNQDAEGGFDLEGQTLEWFRIEVKRQETPRLAEWFNKADWRREENDQWIPVVFWRRNNEQWRVFLELDPFRFTHYVRLVNALRGDLPDD